MSGLTVKPTLIVLDPVGGVSGDMFIAAVLDAFPALADPVLATIRGCGLPAGSFAELTERESGGLAARGFIFATRSEAPSGDYISFRERIGKADLTAETRRHALAILALLAEAEGAVHRQPVEDVHFHELADWDTQADIVGAARIIELLEGARWQCRPLPPGEGMVKTAHGILPLPAPATAHLLTGFAFRGLDGAPGERVTPTGAAILRYLDASRNGDPGQGRLIATGVGAGTRTLPGLPNILRVLAFAGEAHSQDSVLVIEFDVDDQTPEDLATGLDHLRDMEGVRDVVAFSGIGKKGRPLQAIRLMAEPARRDAVIAAVFKETTTIGLRLRLERRALLERQSVAVTTKGQPVAVKIVERPDGARSGKAEADDIADAAGGAQGRERARRAAVLRALRKLGQQEF